MRHQIAPAQALGQFLPRISGLRHIEQKPEYKCLIRALVLTAGVALKKQNGKDRNSLMPVE
jgi:hypothetical protein